MPEKPPEYPDTFAGRRAARQAREAAGEAPPVRRTLTIRAGIDAPQPKIEVVDR